MLDISMIEEDFDISLNEWLKDPEFKQEYEAVQRERKLAEAMVAARHKRNLTPAEVSRLTGISPGTLRRIETGVSGPSLRTLGKFASGMGLSLSIQLA